MSRLGWLMLLTVIVASLMTTATVHAREWPVPTTAQCGAVVSQVAGADEAVPAGAERGLPHHHGGCHSPIFDVTPAAMPAALMSLRDPAPHAARTLALPQRVVGPALRPPAA